MFTITIGEIEYALPFNRQVIEMFLPHRGWSLLVDQIDEIDLVNGRAVGRWTVNPDHPMLEGHFPEFRVFPGHLTAEAAAQVAGFLLGEELVGKIPMLDGTDMKYTGSVVPGEVIVTTAIAVPHSDQKKRMARVHVAVGQTTVAEGFITARLVTRRAMARLEKGGVLLHRLDASPTFVEI